MVLHLRIGSWPPAFRFSARRILLIALGVTTLALVWAGSSFSKKVSALRAQQAVGPNWSFPSRVYSDGVTLTVGRKMSDAYLRSELRARDYVEVRGSAEGPGTYARDARGYSIALRGFSVGADPAGHGGPERVTLRIQDGAITVVERHGGFADAPPPDLANPPRLEPVLVSMLFDAGRAWRTHVSLKQVPRLTREAIVVSEDRRFYSHIGVDAVGALRAFGVNLRKGQVRQGGSTITQQLARGLFLGRERTLARKLAEVPLAMGLEARLSKQEILEMYVNSVYWGQARGFAVGGIESAARWYFDVPVESLTVLQGATLAAMIPAPNLYDPFKFPGRVRSRRNAILQALEQRKALPPGEAARLARAPLGTRRGKVPVERFPSYSSYVNDALSRLLSPGAATHSGLLVFTTMDLAWQEAAEREMENGLARLDPARRQLLEGAFVALEPSRGSVLVMVGGRESAIGSFNRAFQARRQTGSAIKPVVYAAALEHGLTPATTVSDLRVTYVTEDSQDSTWRPRNLDGEYYPRVTLAKALEKSLNLATTAVVDSVGPQEIARVAARFGLVGLKPVLSIGLGSNEASLVQLVNAYAVFPARGRLRKASPLRIVMDRTGRRVAGPPGEASQAIRPDIAAVMTGLLQNVTIYGVAEELRKVHGFQRPVAGKTGTTNEYRDAWFVGFTPGIVAGVWVGCDQPRNIGGHGATMAMPLWARVVGRMLEGFPAEPFASDAEVDWAYIDPWRGCLASAGMRAERTPFLRGTAPRESCPPLPPSYGPPRDSADHAADSTRDDREI